MRDNSNPVQCAMVLDHLQRNRALTPIEALNLYGIFRLAARIYELRRAGNEIITNIIPENGKRFASYILIKLAGKR